MQRKRQDDIGTSALLLLRPVRCFFTALTHVTVVTVVTVCPLRQRRPTAVPATRTAPCVSPVALARWCVRCVCGAFAHTLAACNTCMLLKACAYACACARARGGLLVASYMISRRAGVWLSFRRPRPRPRRPCRNPWRATHCAWSC
jgi:hypothetical protein